MAAVFDGDIAGFGRIPLCVTIGQAHRLAAGGGSGHLCACNS